MKPFSNNIILFFILFTVNVYGRAGYSGGSRGGGGYSGGGSYSSYYYSHGGAGSWANSSPYFWLTLVTFPLLAIIVTLLMYWHYKSTATKNAKRAKTLLRRASLEDSFWNERRLKKQVQTFFISLQNEWSKNDISILQDQISPYCFKKLSYELFSMKRRRVYNFVSNIGFDTIEIIGVRDYKKNDHDSFSVLIEGKMVDEIIKEGYRPGFFKRKEFADIYEFRRIGDQIILYRILPYKAIYDNVIKNLKE